MYTDRNTGITYPNNAAEADYLEEISKNDRCTHCNVRQHEDDLNTSRFPGERLCSECLPEWVEAEELIIERNSLLDYFKIKF